MNKTRRQHRPRLQRSRRRGLQALVACGSRQPESYLEAHEELVAGRKGVPPARPPQHEAQLVAACTVDVPTVFKEVDAIAFVRDKRRTHQNDVLEI